MSRAVGWHAVDAAGCDLATGRPPRGPGRPSAAAALAAAPVPAWPLEVVDSTGRRVTLAAALGPGGDRVAALLDALAGMGGDGVDVEWLARATPAGTVRLPLAVVPLGEGVEAAARIDPGWLAAVDRLRAATRRALTAAGRDAEMEAALHVALLVATERFDPADDFDVDAHVASGARLWLLAGAVVSALSGAEADPFWAWGRLVVAGWWPVGPSDGRLVLTMPAEATTARRAG
jgi:hypothetical protein